MKSPGSLLLLTLCCLLLAKALCDSDIQHADPTSQQQLDEDQLQDENDPIKLTNSSETARSLMIDDSTFNDSFMTDQLLHEGMEEESADESPFIFNDPLLLPPFEHFPPEDAFPPVFGAISALEPDRYPSAKHGQEGFVPVPRKIGSRLRDSFFTSSVIDDLKIAAPSALLKVQFPNHATVCLGNHLSFIDTMLEPSLNWPAAVSLRPSVTIAGKRKQLRPLYTIIMVDPDVPIFTGQFVHMLKVNVPGAGSRGHTVIPYTPPVPILPAKNKPPSRFVHRYIQLIFAQNKVIQPEHAKDYLLGESLAFKLSKFIKAFVLDPVPVAGNFFYGSMYARSKVVC